MSAVPAISHSVVATLDHNGGGATFQFPGCRLTPFASLGAFAAELDLMLHASHFTRTLIKVCCLFVDLPVSGSIVVFFLRYLQEGETQTQKRLSAYKAIPWRMGRAGPGGAM